MCQTPLHIAHGNCHRHKVDASLQTSLPLTFMTLVPGVEFTFADVTKAIPCGIHKQLVLKKCYFNQTLFIP
jgi:hypothetical protein